MKNTLGSTFLLLLLPGICHGAGVITFDLLRVPTGESVTFTTSVKPTEAPFVAVTWNFNGTVNIVTSTVADVVGSGYEGRVSLDRTTGALVLKNLTEADSGKYELIIITDTASQLHGTAEIKVISTVLTASIECPGAVVEGLSPLKLTCEAEGTVENREWMKDGQILVPSDKYSFSEGNRVISINSVHRGDTGSFQCNASNEVSSATATCDLTVYYGPDSVEITQKPIGAELEERVTLTCSAVSLPAASFFWTFKDLTMKGNVYKIRELEEYHLGKYTCIATNPASGQSVSAVHKLTDSAVPVSGSVSMMLLCVVLAVKTLVMEI